MILSSPDPAADPYFASALLDLQRTAFEIEAALIGTRDIPPLQQDHTALAGFRGSWVVAWEGTELVGAAAWRTGPVAEIEKVMVHPSAHRRGIGSALMSWIIERESGHDIVVTTGRDNPPGVALYSKHGFVAEGEAQARPGVWLTRLRRPAAP